ncbi:cadmium resistance transporter [Amycolatopsis australiensis]|uniref:Cadmium resistance protein CadD, predicted permease n=1 Tax=Amycolatopsis australiensis TaxID=546364 RepID=A0A1K1S4N9_9PSEU|nr:cadmium resistance transporter [Amycolatopsis australiensis]SFW79162.1 Cadmium resistance protein CadD, predicted permease [Amycolatopsis australiensis]
MDFGVIGRAAGLFAVTNVDDLVVLALFFAQGAGHPGSARRVAIGQYAGFTAILAVAAAAASGAALLPARVLPYLGLLPVALGVRAAVRAWRHRHDPGDGKAGRGGGPGVLEVAAVTLADGGDNIGVYVPVFATAGVGGMTGYLAVFLVLVAGWLAAGRFFATRPAIAKALSRRGHFLLPLVLIGIGVLILLDGP